MATPTLPAGVPQAELDELLQALYTAETSEQCLAASNTLADRVKEAGVSTFVDTSLLDQIAQAAKDKKSGLKREAAMLAYTALYRQVGPPAELFLLPTLSIVFDAFADKGEVVREAAQMAVDAFLDLFPAEAAGTALFPVLFEVLDGLGKWQAKVAALDFLKRIKERAPDQVALHLVELIDHVTERMHETKLEVSNAAIATMGELCTVITNLDIIPRLPELIDCMAHPNNVVTTMQHMSATTFVQEVNAPVLAVLVPLLTRALGERGANTQRQTVIVVDNVCKLVRDPREAARFLPELMPGVQHIKEEAAMPEVRELAGKAYDTLIKAGAAHRKAENEVDPLADLPVADVEAYLKKDHFGWVAGSTKTSVLKYVSSMIAEMVNARFFGKKRWHALLPCYFRVFLEDATAADAAVDKTLAHFMAYDKTKYGSGQQEVEEGEIEIVNTDFSLAYGGMMLLNHTNLTLYKGHKYGLCGHNGAGKSTLMRSIASGKLEGFPSKEELKTCFVEHKLQGAEGDRTVLDYILHDPDIQTTHKEAEDALASVGFDEERRVAPVSSLSGGWKMKLELARAMVMHADILLLDEPTNHLDVKNVAWLVTYLQTQKDITALIVSHDSGFLDEVCTDIIHYEQRKLAYYKGNLSEFVKRKPEAKSYYTLTATNQKFTFPPPGNLTGVRSNTKAILRMTDAIYTYPNAPKPSLNGVTCSLSLSSRVAIIGANGAGKSTLIKVLTGEVIPQEGKVDKHPNLRIGYVAQHAFHHVEQHLEKTPSQYLQWRYAGGEDREVLMKQSRQLTPEEALQLEKPITVDGEKRIIEFVIGRQKLKKSFQYEIKWRNKLHKHNTWLRREDLLEHGFQKLVQSFDDYESSREGLGFRELTPAVIRQHFEDVGLPGDIADHGLIKGLSGGQKVKVVIAASMWNNPHVLVLDEPTNYLDRDALGGLAVAIRDWGGGVVMISHNEEFVGALCPEQWHVEAGKIIRKGKVSVDGDRFEDAATKEGSATSLTGSPATSLAGTNGSLPDLQALDIKEDDPTHTGRIKPRKKKKKTRNELKAQEARRRARYLAWLNDKDSGPTPPENSDSE